MTNSREHPLDDLRRHPPTETMVSIPEIVRVEADIENRHYAPIETALRNEASGYDWKRETGDIESYQHNQTGGWLHIDPQSQFYDRQVQPTTREAALEHAVIVLAANGTVQHNEFFRRVRTAGETLNLLPRQALGFLQPRLPIVVRSPDAFIRGSEH